MKLSECCAVLERKVERLEQRERELMTRCGVLLERAREAEAALIAMQQPMPPAPTLNLKVEIPTPPTVSMTEFAEKLETELAGCGEDIPF